MDKRQLDSLIDVLDEVNRWLDKTADTLKIARTMLTNEVIEEGVRAGSLKVVYGNRIESEYIPALRMDEPWELVCECYVKDLDDEAQFLLRWGAHELSCPVYRESGDPVDRKHDKQNREHLMQLHGFDHRQATSD